MVNKTNAQLNAESQFLRRSRAVEAVTSVLNNLVRWAGAVLIARYGYLSISELAGQTTFADIGVNILSDLRVSQAVAWLLGGGGVAYGLQQRKLRRDTVERLQGRISSFEKALDPGRTSSQLTPRGETRPEDL